MRSPVRLDNAARAGELLVPLNKSQVIEVDRPFEEVSIGNPAIADVVALTRNSLYVFGKQFGTTSLTITDSNGSLIAVVDLVVSYDIEGLKAQMFQLLPGEAIEVRPASDGLVLSGRLSNAMRMQRALALAERYAPGKITNLMEVTGSQQVMLAVRFAEVSREVDQAARRQYRSAVRRRRRRDQRQLRQWAVARSHELRRRRVRARHR